MKEFKVTFHVTVDTQAEADDWRRKALEILDNNNHKLVNDETDDGMFCSGHVADEPTIHTSEHAAMRQDRYL